MSYVTNVILHIGILENKDQKIEEVNTYFQEQDIYPLVSVTDEKLPRDWYGGSKRLECNLYLGAFNDLYLDGFIAHLRTIQWKDPESLQLIIKEQGDDKFRVIDILPDGYNQSHQHEQGSSGTMNIPKYRAWHKQFKLMMPVLEINLDPEHGGVFVESKDGHYCGCRLYMDLWPWSDIELMQFTEYTDCESKDIYGGDRVRTDNEQRYDTPVDEHYQGVVFYDEIRAMYRIKQSGSNYMPALTNDAIVSIEVIGNIWENSDLLAQEQQS